MAKKAANLAALIEQLIAWCHAYGYQADICRAAYLDSQARNAENTSTTGRPNALVAWCAGVAPRTLLFRDAMGMSEAEFVEWLRGEQQKEQVA